MRHNAKVFLAPELVLRSVIAVLHRPLACTRCVIIMCGTVAARLTSHPLAGSPSQSENPSAHLPRLHTPATHWPGRLGPPQAALQLPQLAVLESVLVCNHGIGGGGNTACQDLWACKGQNRPIAALLVATAHTARCRAHGLASKSCGGRIETDFITI